MEHVATEAIKKQEDKMFKIYVTDVLKIIAESWGSSINARYEDWIELPDEHDHDEEETGDNIALEVIKNAGLKVTV